MAATAPIPPATNEVILNELSHLRQEFREFKAEYKQDKAENHNRLRSVEDDRLRAWTIIGFLGVLGLGTTAAFLKWLLTTH
jgi:hypothetical protein